MRLAIAVALVIAILLAGATAASGAVRKVSLTTPVEAGDYASLTVSVSPRARCTIQVIYDTVVSKAKGLGPKTGGRITWRWRVGTNTHPRLVARHREVREGGDAEDKDSGAAAMKHQATSLALVISVLVLGLAGCGGGDEEAASAPTGETTTTETTTSEAPGPAPELTPEPKDLVLQLSDLPTGYSIDPDETGPRSLSEALEDATPEEAALIRKERVGSYEVTFNSPNLRVISCTATVYRTSDAAAQIYRRGLERVQEPVKEGEPQLEPASLDDSLGDEAAAFTGESDGVSIFTILWRDRNVLALCATGGLIATDPAETVRVARAQQERIAEALR